MRRNASRKVTPKIPRSKCGVVGNNSPNMQSQLHKKGWLKFSSAVSISASSYQPKKSRVSNSSLLHLGTIALCREGEHPERFPLRSQWLRSTLVRPHLGSLQETKTPCVSKAPCLQQAGRGQCRAKMHLKTRPTDCRQAAAWYVVEFDPSQAVFHSFEEVVGLGLRGERLPEVQLNVWLS